MRFPARRVVTGHDEKGHAIVKIDEISTNRKSSRPGLASCEIWSVTSVPADLSGDRDGELKGRGGFLPQGAVFRIVEYGPGCTPRRHRTESIDFAVVLSGEIVMEVDDTEVLLKAGDLLVQRGTVHSWLNRGTVPCVIAFVLVGAKPVEAGGKVLTATG